MSFNFESYLTDHIMKKGKTGSERVEAEIDTFIQRMLEKYDMDKAEVLEQAFVYRLIITEDKERFAERMKNVHSHHKRYELFSYISVARAAFAGDDYFLRYFMEDVDKHYRGKTHKAILKLLSFYQNTLLTDVEDAIEKAIQRFNAIEEINWGIWGSKLINESICHWREDELTTPWKNAKQEKTFRILCENGAYFTNVNHVTDSMIQRGLCRWYSSLSTWPGGAYFDHERVEKWIVEWLDNKGLEVMDVLPDVKDADKKVFLMKLIAA